MEILTNRGEIHFSVITLDRERVKDVGLSFFLSFFLGGGVGYGGTRCFSCRRMRDYSMNAENHVFNFVTEIFSIFTSSVDYTLSCLADSILNINKYI